MFEIIRGMKVDGMLKPLSYREASLNQIKYHYMSVEEIMHIVVCLGTIIKSYLNLVF